MHKITNVNKQTTIKHNRQQRLQILTYRANISNLFTAFLKKYNNHEMKGINAYFSTMSLEFKHLF